MNLLRHLRRAGLLGDGTDGTDGELLSRYVRLRDEAAFEALVYRHGPMVWGVCRRILGSEADAEDAFQATFLILARKAATVVPPERVGNWLHGVARTTALKAHARKRQRQAHERQAGSQPRPSPEPDGADICAVVDEEVSRLPEKYRLPIILVDLEGRPLRETAETLGWPPGTVAGRLARARALLAKRLARRGLGPPTLVPPVPAALVAATVQLAGGVAVPASVAILAEGVLRTMLLTKLKKTSLVLAVLAAVVATVGLALPTTVAQGPTGSLAPFKPAPVAADLQGTWRAVAARWDETFERPPSLRGANLTVTDDRASWRDGEFVVRSAGEGGNRLDFKATTDGVGVRAGDTLAVVYAVTGDTLRLAYREVGDRANPPVLEPTPGSGCVQLELKRRAPDKAAADTLSFQLRNVAAAEAATVLKSLFGDKGPAIAADARTNTLIVGGTPQQVAQVRELLTKVLDKNPPPVPVPAVAEAEVVVARLKSVEAATLAKLLTAVLDDQAGRIVADPATNSLLIRATPKQLDTIQALIEKLDVPPEGPGM